MTGIVNAFTMEYQSDTTNGDGVDIVGLYTDGSTHTGDIINAREGSG